VGGKVDSTGYSFLGDVADRLVTFTEVGLNRGRLPAEPVSDVLDRETSGSESDCGGHAIRV
jgi:hypothetical protein